MATTTNFGWETPDDTDLVKDGALAIRTLGSAIDTSLVDLKGGTTGQVLSKTSNTDMDFTWINNDQGDITEVQAGTGISVTSGTGPIPVVTNTVATAFDAKGDLIAGIGADTFARLAVGTNDQVLTADSTTATGLKWATPASGKVLQVVRATDANKRSTTSTTFTDVTGVSVSITPTSATSNIWIIVTAALEAVNSTNYANYTITDSSNVSLSGAESQYLGKATIQIPGFLSAYVAASNTNARTYKLRFRTDDVTTTAQVRGDQSTTQIFAIEIGA